MEAAARVQRYGLNIPANIRYGVVAMGHSRVRLNPGTVGFSHLRPGGTLEVIGPTGGEANVSITFGRSAEIRSALLTALVKGDPWDGVIRAGYRLMNVDTGFNKGEEFVHGPRGPVYGTVFSPTGAGEDSPEVSYHVAGEAAALLEPGYFDLDAVHSGGTFVAHTGGIFSTVGPKTPEAQIEFLRDAKNRGINTSYDANFRGKLWGIDPKDPNSKELLRARGVYGDIMPFVDMLEGNKSDFANAFGIEIDKSDPMDIETQKTTIKRTLDKFKDVKVVLTNIRHELDANNHLWRVLAYIDGEFYFTPTRHLTVVDRVGGGDATTSYLLWSILQGKSPQEAVEIADAAGGLKTAYVGDTLECPASKVVSRAKAIKEKGAAEISR